MVTLVLRFFEAIFLIYIPLFLIIPKFRENTQKGLNKFFMVIGGMIAAIDLISAFWIYRPLVNLLKESNVNEGYGNQNILYFVISFLLATTLFVFGWKHIKTPIKTVPFYFWWILLVVFVFTAIELVIMGAVSPISKIPSNF